LIVGLHTDPTIDRLTEKERPVQTVFERWAQLKSVSSVDDVVPYETEADLCNLLATLEIDVRFLGSDYQGCDFITGNHICEQRGIKILYAPRLHTFSSTELRSRLRGRPHEAGDIL
jgi:glycerol-3-phosphate cytidylyltransferase